jgi:NAD(P)-dependent dehydrogenase (short-subunit alcohol dehydrogenase family)
MDTGLAGKRVLVTGAAGGIGAACARRRRLSRLGCLPRTRATLDDSRLIERVTRTMPLRKVGAPEDVARQVVVLASDELSGHVRGEVVVVAGGMEGRVLHEE